MEDFVVLVDKNDCELGAMEKMEAHLQGVLHRAFSIFLFNDADEMLLHQRSFAKYHCAGLWTNACCSHPRQDEPLEDAVKRRLKEELGITTSVQKIHQFIYKALLPNNLIEHELDHVFVGRVKDTIKANTHEVADWKFITLESLVQDIRFCPEKYTPWFKIIMDENITLLQNFLTKD